MGRDKALLPWNGTTMLGHAVRRLGTICSPVSLCADRDDLQQYLAADDVHRIGDAEKNAGPLAAIVAGLEQTRTEWNLFLAVDLPLVPVEFLRWLAEQAMRAPRPAVCLVPQVDGRPQPLCAMYHRSLAVGLRRALIGGTHKMLLALQDAGAGEIPPAPGAGAAIERIDVDGIAELSALHPQLPVSQWFFNVNTPQDWELLRQLRNPEPAASKAPTRNLSG